MLSLLFDTLNLRKILRVFSQYSVLTFIVSEIKKYTKQMVRLRVQSKIHSPN